MTGSDTNYMAYWCPKTVTSIWLSVKLICHRFYGSVIVKQPQTALNTVATQNLIVGKP